MADVSADMGKGAGALPRFAYIAIDEAGKRRKGEITAADDQKAFAQLKGEGLHPVSLKAATAPAPNPTAVPTKARPARPDQATTQKSKAPIKAKPLSDRVLAELLANLGALLRAGADIRSALSILGAKSADKRVDAMCQSLSADISGGLAVDQALSDHLTQRQQFVAAIAAAGQASGSLASGVERAANILETRMKLRDQLVSALSYPAFVFVSAVVSVLVILLFIVPALAPLAEDSGAEPPLTLALMIAVSNFLRAELLPLGLILFGLVTGLIAAAQLGWLETRVDRLLLRGPASRTVGGLVFGGFAISLGAMLTGGAPMTDALKLAVRTVRSPLARTELEAMAQAVRQGQSLSTALSKVKTLPGAIVRLTAVGENTGALGAMLLRAGEMEETASVRRIERLGQLLGPLLIVLLGGLIGLLMAGLLSGVSLLGDSALR